MGVGVCERIVWGFEWVDEDRSWRWMVDLDNEQSYRSTVCKEKRIDWEWYGDNRKGLKLSDEFDCLV